MAENNNPDGLDDEKKRYIALIEELSREIKEAMNGWLTKHKDDLSRTEAFLICYRVLAFKLGYVDSICKRFGLSEESRIKLCEDFMRLGVKAAAESAATKHPELMIADDVQVPKNSLPN